MSAEEDEDDEEPPPDAAAAAAADAPAPPPNDARLRALGGAARPSPGLLGDGGSSDTGSAYLLMTAPHCAISASYLAMSDLALARVAALRALTAFLPSAVAPEDAALAPAPPVCSQSGVIGVQGVGM